MRDRNGNEVRYDAIVATAGIVGWTITDSLKRQIIINYDVNDGPPYGVVDRITIKGFGGADRYIRIKEVFGGPLRTTQPTDPTTYWTVQQLFPELDNVGSYVGGLRVSTIWMPDGRTYNFKYNVYWELARVELPTGGAIEYDYSGGYRGSASGGARRYYTVPRYPVPAGSEPPLISIYRRLVERRVYSGLSISTLIGKTTYSKPEIIITPGGDHSSNLLVEQWDPSSGACLARCRHYFNYSAYYSLLRPWAAGAEDVLEGKEIRTEAMDTSPSMAVLRRVENVWGRNTFVANNGFPIWIDPHVVETKTTLVDANLVSKQTFGYGQYNNQNEIYEYGFGAGAPGPLIRRTHTDYVTFNNGVDYAADANIHIRNLPLQQQAFDAGGTKRAETFYEYDLYGNSPNHAPLTDRPGISGLDSGFTNAYTTRGNVTRTSSALLNNSGGVTGWINGHAQYDIAGNVVKAIDANGNPTQFDFRDNFGSPDDPAVQSSASPANNAPGELGGQMSYAFPFKVTNALGHKTYTKYDYYLGRAALSEDANGVKSNIYFNDALDRPTSGVRAIGTSVASQTVFVYNDSDSPVYGYPARSITTISDKDVFGESNNGNGLKSVALYDELGRTWRGATYEGSTWTIKDTQFDALGRVSQVSNPYYATDPGSASPPSGLWTTTDYDALGRVSRVTTPDGAHVDTAYSGNQVTVTDQAGKKRRSETDALGRLVKVTEDPGGLNYDTTYIYDPLGNLRYVQQGAQGRSFSYDSLSRLIRVRNPEQSCDSNLPPHTDPFTGGSCWATAYSYDSNSNLTKRIDARGIETKYYYDALNRNWGIDYFNGSQKSNLVRVFDGAVNGKGRLYWDRTQVGGTQEMGTNVAADTIDSYDALGRPLQKRQSFWQGSGWSHIYAIQYAYDLAGNVKTLTYPSGRTVNYTYDQASRLSSFSGNLGGSPATYADTINYNAAGQMSRERFGTSTSLYQKKRYNNRLQLVDVRLSTANDELSWDRGAITFYYGWNGIPTSNLFADDPTNNGNLVVQITYVPTSGGGIVVPQGDAYYYDALNRITSVNESQVDANNTPIYNVYTQNFSYDRWGNRQITSATGGVNNYNPVYYQATNQIVGLGYDAAGNITYDPLNGGTMTYDPENRLLTASNGAGGSYTYDADGKRVKRITGGQETWYIYGDGGELLAEYQLVSGTPTLKKEYGYRNGQLLVIAEPGSGGNLAWGKATSQSSTGFGGNSSRGADGNTNGNWGDNSVTHTNNEHQPWWQVDLGSVQQIGTVRLWNRTDCCSERVSNFYVLVSDNPFSSTDLTTTINQSGVSSYYTAGQAGLLTGIGVGRSGKYVRVQLAGDNYLSLAEVEVLAGTASGEGVKWLVQDHLGSTRMVVDRSGSVGGVRRDDFAPFGEELSAGVGIRSAALGYGADSTRQKFTGKERDDETGLDYFGARYYGSVMGRFTSVDPVTVTPGRVIDPQQLNLYAYVRNNPLAFIDPTGMIIDTSLLNEKDLEKWKKIAELANAKDKNGNYVDPKLHEVYEKLDSDKRTFFIENTKLGASTSGRFEITKFNGANDFSEAVIHLDFKKIESINTVTKADLVEGFNKFEGLLDGDKKIQRLAEVFGHEGGHGVYALNNIAESVQLQ